MVIFYLLSLNCRITIWPVRHNSRTLLVVDCVHSCVYCDDYDISVQKVDLDTYLWGYILILLLI